jgi:hypothetical protein
MVTFLGFVAERLPRDGELCSAVELSRFWMK